jgi:hypothetical protein
MMPSSDNGSSPALGISMTSALPYLHEHPTLSLQSATHAENIELAEVNAGLRPDHNSIQEVSETSKSFRFRARIQFFSLCWTLFLAGWSDSSTGPLLPRMQSAYHVLVFGSEKEGILSKHTVRLALLLSPLYS